MYDILELNKKLVSELRDIAKDLDIKRVESLRKQDLIYKILDQQAISATENRKQNSDRKTDQLKAQQTEKIKINENVPFSENQHRQHRMKRKRIDKANLPESDRINAAVAEVEASLKLNAPLEENDPDIIKGEILQEITGDDSFEEIKKAERLKGEYDEEKSSK